MCPCDTERELHLPYIGTKTRNNIACDYTSHREVSGGNMKLLRAKNIPNVLSVFRLLMVPAFIAVFFLDYPAHILAALSIFILAGATDVVDGYLARHYGWISNLGKVLDPLADKTMQCAVLICLYIKHIIPLWLLVLYAAKELAMLSGAMFIFRKMSVIVVSRWCGKLAVCVFYAAVFSLLMLENNGARTPALTYAICGVTILVAVIALVMYATEYIKKRKAQIESERNTK